jgi:hypothetical protein
MNPYITNSDQWGKPKWKVVDSKGETLQTFILRNSAIKWMKDNRKIYFDTTLKVESL